jgi:putative glycosyltransferase (TIGR04372 family)
MNLLIIKNLIKKKLTHKREDELIFFFAISHIIRYFYHKSYRAERCLIDTSGNFFHKYGKLSKFFSFPLIFLASYLKRKKIFISINNDYNYSPGHIYGEIDTLKKMQYSIDKFNGSTIWFTTSRKNILKDTKEIFEEANFKIIFGGLKRFILIFTALRYPEVAIDGSISSSNYQGGKMHSYRIVFSNLAKKRLKLNTKCQNFFPNRSKLNNYKKESKILFDKLNINKKFVVIQIKTHIVNGTFECLNPDIIIKAIKYLKNNNYQIVLAGREKCPESFLKESVIDYANSIYANSLNDYLVVGHSSMVIASASGFCFIPETLDKPLLMTNAHHICQSFGRRTIYLPTILSQNSKVLNPKEQYRYLCTYGPDCGLEVLGDIRAHHLPNSEEFLMGVKELEGMLSHEPPPLTTMQQKVTDQGNVPLLKNGLSRISDYFISKHMDFFDV